VVHAPASTISPANTTATAMAMAAADMIREVITLAGGMAVWSLAARAQQAPRMKRVAMVNPALKPKEMR
jgi:hypothetical protein